MLTKDLIQCRIERGRVKPKFIDPTSPELLRLAGDLLAVYQSDPPLTRGEIGETVSPLMNASRDAKLARGLNKLILDRAEFRQAGEVAYPELRAGVFAASAEWLRNRLPESIEEFRAGVCASSGFSDAEHPGGLYADLPDNEPLVHLRDLTPSSLLERYNVGLVQALLFTADSLELELREPEAAALRRLFKYLRFFRLLAKVERKKKGVLLVTVDGPASVLSQNKRYGLQLASFFPAVCALEKWTLRTTVDWKRSRREFRLDQKSGLVCHYRNFGAYVPEEIRLFHRHFVEKSEEWTIVGGEGRDVFLELGGQELLFPDLSFSRSDGVLVHLELFHRWHATSLLLRLKQLEGNADLPLILGVDRAIAGRKDISQALESSAWFAERGFLFRDYPTVDRTLGCLKRAVSAAGP